MSLNESFWQSSTKKKERKLNHSSRICVQALLQCWPTPRVHISTTSLITRSCGRATCCPPPCRKTASRTGARVLLPVLWRSESQLHAWNWKWKRLQDPGTFFPNLLRALRWKRPLVVCWTLRSHDELAPPKTLEKKEGVPRWNQCWTLWARQIGASSTWFYSLAWSVFAGTLTILRGSDRDPRPPNRDVWVRTVRKSRPSFVKRSGSFDQTSCVYGIRVLCLFLLLFLFHFYIFQKRARSKPSLPQTGMPVFW